MQVNQVALQNFKCFKSIDLKLAPITLLTGANSSGKSSFLYSILSTFQSESFPFYLSPNGSFVDLGSFSEISFNHKNSNIIKLNLDLDSSFGYRSRSKTYIETAWIENKRNKLPQLHELLIQSKGTTIKIRNTNSKFLLSIEEENDTGYFLNKLKPTLLKIPEIEKAEKLSFKKAKIEIINAPFKSVEELLHKTFFNDDTSFFKYYTADLKRMFDSINNKINFIGSFRQPPARTYYLKSKLSSKIDISGQGYIDQIVEWEDSKNKNFKELNRILNKLQLLKRIKSFKMKGGRFELRIQPKSLSVLSSLADVGFGISQFLPIIVADLQLSQDSMLMISQPEIHLHPKIQATLGDYVSEQIKKTKKQYLIETHSEYLINRLRLNVVKKIISTNDVIIYHFQNEKDGTQIFPITLKQSGEIVGAPKDFFDTYMIDVMNIALNA